MEQDAFIRGLLSEGKMEEIITAQREPYAISGIVEHGRRVGTSLLDMPTANIRPPRDAPIKSGVYITKTTVDGQKYASVTNLGVRPTFEPDYLMETYILDFSGNLYGKTIRVEFLRYLRPEIKFAGKDALKAQMARDAETSRHYIEQQNKQEDLL